MRDDPHRAVRFGRWPEKLLTTQLIISESESEKGYLSLGHVTVARRQRDMAERVRVRWWVMNRELPRQECFLMSQSLSS